MYLKIALIVSACSYAFAAHHAISYYSMQNYIKPVRHGYALFGHQRQRYPQHHPKYEFNYGVEVAHTGNQKSQKEQRSNNIDKGDYFLHPPNRRVRIVYYNNGFNAHVLDSEDASENFQNKYL